MLFFSLDGQKHFGSDDIDTHVSLWIGSYWYQLVMSKLVARSAYYLWVDLSCVGTLFHFHGFVQKWMMLRTGTALICRRIYFVTTYIHLVGLSNKISGLTFHHLCSIFSNKASNQMKMRFKVWYCGWRLILKWRQNALVYADRFCFELKHISMNVAQVFIDFKWRWNTAVCILYHR